MGGMMNPYAMLGQQVGNYYAGPSGIALGSLIAGQAIGDAFKDMGQAARQRKEDAVRSEEKQRMYDLQAQGQQRADQQFQWQQDEAQRKQVETNRGRVATYWAVNGGESADPGGKQFMERYGYNPYEYANADTLARMQDKEAQRAMQMQLAQDRNDVMREVAGMRQQGNKQERYRFMPMVGADGATKIFAIDPTDPTAPPIEVGAAPRKGEQTGAGLLPLDTTARKNLAEWNTQAADAARVADELDRAMGAKVDPATGKKVYPEQPSSPFSGGTGLLLGSMPDKFAARMDPQGVPVRSAITNFSSQIMNALSGAAVSEQEKKRLEAFLPTTSDDWGTLRQKMGGYRDYLRSKGDAWRMSYGDHEALGRGMSALGYGAPAQAPAQPPQQPPSNGTRPPLSSFGGD